MNYTYEEAEKIRNSSCGKSPNGEHMWRRFSDTIMTKGDKCEWCFVEIDD